MTKSVDVILTAMMQD